MALCPAFLRGEGRRETGEADVSGLGVSGEKALEILALTDGGYVFQVMAGLFGPILARKKFLFTVTLSVLLFVPQLVNFLRTEESSC